MRTFVWLVWFPFPAAAANFNALASHSRPATIKLNNAINVKAAFVGKLTQKEKRFPPPPEGLLFSLSRLRDIGFIVKQLL